MAAELVTVIIDGQTHQFPKGTILLDACQQVGAKVPFFCWHPGLSSPAVCRQCLVEVKGAPKLVPSCYTPVADKMDVLTNSAKAVDARRQVLEFTLLNHPIDCPICDKAGECTLQKHYFDFDARYARNEGIKVRKAKVMDVGPHIVLDQERCILCTRCIRVCNEVARKPDLTMAMRGDHQVLTTAPGRKLDNPYSLNTVDVCPVGALTSKDFRFAMRAWELWATPSICPGCATGCNIEVHASRGQIARLVPRANADVNRHWMCDEGRFTYKAVHDGRLLAPSLDGAIVDWSQALNQAARLLKASPKLGVVISAQACNEDVFAVTKLTDALKVERIYLAGAPEGWSDDILVSADKNPNTAGVRRIVGTRLLSEADLERDLGAGVVSTLLVLGDVDVKNASAVVMGWHKPSSAQVALPLSAWAEVDGTVTNRQSHVQRLHAAIASPGQAEPGWKIVGRLAQVLGLEWEIMSSAEQVFRLMADRIATMKDAEWGRTQVPVQLRFANSRG
jgi:NADH-quinone oxidoreductase subunit G